MKTNIQKVYSKLPKKKLGLKKHNVKLSLAEDINIAINLIEPIMNDGQDYDTKLEELSKIDFFAIKGIEDAYFEEVHYNADRLKTLVDAQW